MNTYALSFRRMYETDLDFLLLILRGNQQRMSLAAMMRYIKDYWSTDFLIATPIFCDIIPRDGFLLLLKFIY